MADQDPRFNAPRLAPSRDGQLRDRTDRTTQRAEAQVARPGRTLGVYVRRVAERAFGFLKDEAGEEYFAHMTGFVDAADFTGLPDGAAVSFRVRETAKGLRAFDIRRATDEEEEAIHGWAETRGNR